MKIYIGTDHRGVEIEKQIVSSLRDNNYEVEESNLPHSDTDDYVDFAFDVANKVKNDKDSFGILICGTGIGMSIAANKNKGIRAARCTSPMDAYHTRNDNHSNVLCLGYNQDLNVLLEIIDTFLNTKGSLEERHLRRVGKITSYEEGV